MSGENTKTATVELTASELRKLIDFHLDNFKGRVAYCGAYPWSGAPETIDAIDVADRLKELMALHDSLGVDVTGSVRTAPDGSVVMSLPYKQ